jgi:hypothetical protein
MIVRYVIGNKLSTGHSDQMFTMKANGMIKEITPLVGCTWQLRVKTKTSSFKIYECDIRLSGLPPGGGVINSRSR